MKIKTITCHDVYNHGASLQAYALMHYLENEGNDVEIIDYKPSYLCGPYKLDSVSNPKWDKPILRLLYLLLKLPGRLCSFRRKKAFDLFTNKYLKITDKRYYSNEELKLSLPQAELYIAGSDQIWNTIFPNGKDPAFYLDFVPNDRSKIAYAASFATLEVAVEYKDFVREKLEHLDAIAVREKTGLSILKELGISNGICVCDPVFLLSEDEWTLMTTPIDSTQQYLLIYDFDFNPLFKDIAKKIAKERNLEIYSVSAKYLNYCKKNYANGGPIEFISLIKNASVVVSNSFHATAFSIIFKKDFFVTLRKENINTRMENLLSIVGLSSHILTLDYTVKQLNQSIDYTTVSGIMNSYISESKKYLMESVK